MPLVLEACPNCKGTGVIHINVWGGNGTGSEPPEDCGYDSRCYCENGRVLAWEEE
jgi:hypothetical protein